MALALFSSSRTRKPLAQDLILPVNGETVTIHLRHNARARRYTLRLPQGGGAPVLTVPKHGTVEEAKAFALRQVDWLAQRLAQRVRPVAFVDGAVIPFRGVDHRIVVDDRSRGKVRVENGEGGAVLKVPGGVSHTKRRLTDWLKDQAREALEDACHVHADALGLVFRSIAIRDTRTRWGSCSSQGRLNFSWRLILAPAEVLDYVAAHEVAHLEEMNHRPEFWALVRKTCPNMERHRRWLKKNGHRLHAYGGDEEG